MSPARAGPSAAARPARVAQVAPEQAVAALVRSAPAGHDPEAAERHADAVAEQLAPVLDAVLLRGPAPPRPAGPPPQPPPHRAVPPAGPPAAPAAAAGTSTPGEPLAPALAESLAPLLGTNLDPVRLHRGPGPAQAAAEVGAHAYSYGAHVVLGAGQGDPATSTGRRLLAHELAHVAAQARHGTALVQHQPEPFKLLLAELEVPDFLRLLPEVFKALATVILDAVALGNKVSPQVLHPTACFLYTENYVVITNPDGTVRQLIEQDRAAPVMLAEPIVVLRELSSGIAWLVGTRGEAIAIQSYRGFGGRPDPSHQAGESVLLAYMPGLWMPAELVRSLGRRVRGRSGTEAEAPEWARRAAARQRRRRGGAGSEGEGPGAGQQGQGPGGGGTEKSVRAPGSGQPGDQPPAAKPLRGPVRVTASVTRTGAPQLTVTIDRATTNVPLREGERDEAVDRRVDAAVDRLQESRDPSAHEKVAGKGSATATGFAPPPPGTSGAVVSTEQAQEQARSSGTAATPQQRIPGARGGANAMPYPATLLMSGVEPGDAAISSAGATNRFTMKLDYAALSLGVQDETFNRMQSVHFYWELIEVTGLTRGQAEQRVRGTAAGGGEQQTPLGALGTNLSRDARAVAEDQEKDLAMMRDWPWSAQAAYLTVIGLSNTVRLLGSIIGSFVDELTMPLNERSIGFDRVGDFVIRCVATPVWSDEAVADPAHHVLRASSIAALPIRVQWLGARAAEAADREATSVAEARAQLEAALRSGNERRIAAARATLERLLRAGRTGSFDLFTQSLAATRRQLAAAEALAEHVRNRAGVDALSDDEVLLQIHLLQTGGSLEAHTAALKRQLEALTANGNEAWIRAEHDKFAAVGGTTDFRPRLALASRETGQVSEIRTMLGQLGPSQSYEGHRRWALVDITSPGSRDVYVGESGLPGHAGQVAAIRDAFRRFAENAGYGRGTLAIRLPEELATALGAPVPIEAQMESAPGDWGRVKQRLQDLATVAEIAGVFVTGGTAGVVLGAVGGIAGAITATDALVRRARTGHVLELGTLLDVLGVVGGLAAVGQAGAHTARGLAESISRASGHAPAWIDRLEATEKVLHVHAKLGNVQQVISIPASLLWEWNEASEATGITDGERKSRQARALLRAMKDTTVFVASLRTPAAEETDRTRPTGHEELPPGTGAPEAGAVAEGREPPRPPIRERPPAESARGTGDDTPDPAAADLETRAQELAKQRLAAQRWAELGLQPVEGVGTEPRREASSEPSRGAEEQRRRDADERRRPEDRRREDGSGDGEEHTAAGTTRPGPAGGPGAEQDANPGERAKVVTLLELRLGAERPAGPLAAGRERAKPGAFGERTRSAESAVAMYDHAVAAAQGSEVGLFYNPYTGEFAVQVGTEFSVRAPRGDGWHALIHLHPNAENVIVRRLPAPADVWLAVRAAFRTGSHTEFVQSTRPDGSTGITRVTVSTEPMRIVVEMPAAPGEPARRIEADSPEAYAKEYSSEAVHLDPASPLYEWVIRDLDDFFRLRRAEADDDTPLERAPENTAAGTAPPGAPRAPRRPVPTQEQEQALAEIVRLRARLYAWRRRAGSDKAAGSVIDEHLGHLRSLAEAARRGDLVEGALRGIREDLPRQQAVARPVDAGDAAQLSRRAGRMAERSRSDEARAELTRISREAAALAGRMRRSRRYDGRTELDTLNRQARRASREDYEVYVDLTQPGERAQLVGWFEERLLPLTGSPEGVLLYQDVLGHLESADALTLAQSPRTAGLDVARTGEMRRLVLEGIAQGRYTPEYVAAFEAAARGHDDGWPRTPNGEAWHVDHVGELWLGGADDPTNYLALPPELHRLKTDILAKFRDEYRSRSAPEESRDLRATDPPEPTGEE
ncbi:MAG TPA: DUF4157 domain-containing protein [Propionibacteriaceae bacterium]|nr:DUF4157 domain-containing protein [Propionibacteriaceae bacterium]